MNTLTITPDVINSYKLLLTKPEEYGLDFPAITTCLIKSDVPTEKSELVKSYLTYINRSIPKVIMYIIIDQIFPENCGIYTNNRMCYYLKFIKPT